MKNFSVIFVALVLCIKLDAQNVGIGVTAPSQRLDVGGNIKFAGALMPGGNTGTAGQVLTSGGAGGATTWANTAYTGAGRFWITPATNSRSTGSVSGRGGWNLDGADNEQTQSDSLDFQSSNESGTDFTISNPGLVNNYITINKTGLYHFEGSVRYFVTANLSVILLPRAAMYFLANQPASSDLNLLLFEDRMDKTNGSETAGGTNNYNYTARFSINIHLQANSTIAFKTEINLLRFPSATDLIAMGVTSGGYISGHFISE
ncbi:MAG: hypothetical protein V4722_26255 [Bacteroidota bacterium]